jgi:hypothetical protein
MSERRSGLAERRYRTNRRGSELTTNTIILIIIGLLILGAVLWTFKGQIARFISGTEELSSCQGALGSVAGTGTCQSSCLPPTISIGRGWGCTGGNFCCITPPGATAPGAAPAGVPPTDAQLKQIRICAISEDIKPIAEGKETLPKYYSSSNLCARQEGLPKSQANTDVRIRCFFDLKYAGEKNPPCNYIGVEKFDDAKKTCLTVQEACGVDNRCYVPTSVTTGYGANTYCNNNDVNDRIHVSEVSDPAKRACIDKIGRCGGRVGLQQSHAQAASAEGRSTCYTDMGTTFCCYYADSSARSEKVSCYETDLKWQSTKTKICDPAKSDYKCRPGTDGEPVVGYSTALCGTPGHEMGKYFCHYGAAAQDLDIVTCTYSICQ